MSLLVSSRCRSSRTRLGVVAAVVAVVASYSVVGPVSIASAASLTGSGFEIEADANLTLQGATSPPAFDWLTSAKTLTPGAKVKADDPSGSSDDSFQSTKEDSNVPFVDEGGIPGSKSDLKQFGVYVEKTGTATFLNVFWSRVQDPHGSTDMDFEFNQSPFTVNDSSFPAKVDKVVPKRSPGDLLLMYSLQKSGDTPVITKAVWSGSAATGHWGPEQALTSSQALGTINSSAITAANSGGLGPFDPYTFGEASVDLAALITTDQGCVTYGSAYLKSRSGPQFTSELKDFVAPEPVTISNCGSVKLHKTDGTNALQGMVFTLYKDVVPLGAPVGAGDTVTTLTCTTDANGDCVILNVPKGVYLLHETPPVGYDPVADQPVVITSGDQEVDLGTLVDPIQTGTITVTKDAVPNDAQDFTFSLDDQTVTLDDDADEVRSNTKTWTVPVGQHVLTETNIPTGWTLDKIECAGRGSFGGPGVVNITLTKGQTVSCTYTDKFTPLDAHLATQASSAGNGTWNDTATLTGDGTHPVTGTVRFYACNAAATAAACTAGTQVGTPRPVTLSSGATYTASTDAAWTPTAAGHTCFRAVFTSTSGFYLSGEHSNATTECFLKQAADLTVSKTALAAFGRAYSWTVDKSVDNARLAVPAGANATSNYTVKVANTHVDGAWTIKGTVTVTNPNPVDFASVTVTEAVTGGGTCAVTGGTGAVVPANGSLPLSYTCTFAAAPTTNPVTGTSTVTWSAATYFTPTGTATKTGDVDFATVTPSVTDEVVTVTDTVQGTLGTLDARTADNPTTYTYPVVRTGPAGTCTPYDNTAQVVANDSEATTQSSATVTVCVGADLGAGITGTATKDRDDLWTIVKRVDKTRVEMGQGGTATFSYEVEVTPNGSVDSGHALSGTVTATNPNDWEAVTADLTVATTFGATCTVTGGTGVSVPASGSAARPYSCVFTGAQPASGTVTVTVAWSAAAAKTPGSSATATKELAFALASETHKSVTVVDDKTDPAHPVTLGTRDHADGAHTYSYSLTKSGVAGACTSYTNTASLSETGQSAAKTVTVCVGVDLTVRKTALATDHRTYLWTLAKDVDKTTQSIAAGGTATFGYTVTATPAGTTDDGWSVTGQITVTNPNSWRAITATITDAVDSGGGSACLVGNGTAVPIAAGATVTLTYSCTFASQPADGTNTATATWDATAATTPHGTATGTAPVVFVPSSSTNQTITVVDDKTDPSNPVTLGTATYADGPKAFTYSLTKAGTAGTCTDLVNTASIVETQQSASRTARLCVGQALTVQGTSLGSFDRDHLWTIVKSVDRATATAVEGTSVPFTYTVTATPAGVSESGYQLAGTATVSNPNTWEPVTATVTAGTDLASDATCTVTDGVARSVPAGGSLVLAYTCAFATAPAGSGTVSLSAVWDATAASTPVGTAAAAVPTSLVLDQSGHDTVTLTDDQTDPGNVKTIGTATWADGPTSVTYSLSKTAVADRCDTYTNTAALTETGQTATQDVEVCGTAFTGGGGGVTVPPVVTPPTGGGGGLVFTGDMTGVLLRWALALLLGGALVQLAGRKRQA